MILPATIALDRGGVFHFVISKSTEIMAKDDPTLLVSSNLQTRQAATEKDKKGAALSNEVDLVFQGGAGIRIQIEIVKDQFYYATPLFNALNHVARIRSQNDRKFNLAMQIHRLTYGQSNLQSAFLNQQLTQAQSTSHMLEVCVNFAEAVVDRYSVESYKHEFDLCFKINRSVLDFPL